MPKYSIDTNEAALALFKEAGLTTEYWGGMIRHHGVSEEALLAAVQLFHSATQAMEERIKAHPNPVSNKEIIKAAKYLATYGPFCADSNVQFDHAARKRLRRVNNMKKKEVAQ